MTVEEVRGSLDLTDNGAIRNSIRNCLTVFQNDPYLQGAIRYNILTERIDIVKQYAPQQPEDEWHPLFVEALQRESHIEYLLDVLLYGTAEEKKALVAEQRKEVMRLEQRFAEHPDGHDRGRSQGKSGLDR